jgi:chemotaxis protein MotB
MRRAFVVVAGSALLLASACVSRSAHQSQVNAARGLSATLDQYDQYLRQLEQENANLRVENDRYKKTADEAAWATEQADRLKKLLAELEAAGGSTGIQGVEVVRNESGDVGLRVDEAVLFASGQAELSAQGRATIAKLVPILRKDGKTVRIDGHTDSDPIVKSKWQSNLHLSAARALSVSAELNAGGIGFDRIVISGYGPLRPATKTPGDKARNRRVEFYLLSQ